MTTEQVSAQAAPGAGQWDTGRLDLGAYLHRIGYDGRLDPDGGTLTALHRAHVAAIPFENLDVMLGRGISVALGDVQAKLVTRRRGGYCYEHGLLLGAVLERLGYQVDRLLARVGDTDERPRVRSHLVLRVQPPAGGPWLADVGFGSGLLEPLPLAATGPRRQGDWTYRLVPGADLPFLLQEEQRDGWVTQYGFGTEPQYWVDIDQANYVTAHRPSSPFTQRPVVVRKDDATIRELVGRRFSVVRPGRTAEERTLDDAEFAAVLAGVFGPDLSRDEVAALTATLPAAE